MDRKNYRFETLQLHAGQETPDPATDARAVPIYQTTSYVFQDCAQADARFRLEQQGNIYGRLNNPTVEAFEQRMAALEGGAAALGVSSGAAAVTYAMMNLAHGGDHIVASKYLYGGSYNLFAHTLPAYGITASFVDPGQEGALEGAVTSRTKAIYLETIGNPSAALADLEAAAQIAHAHGIPLVVDNTFATPYLVRPLEHGADIVVHSATKFIGGHGTAVGGVIVDGGTFDWGASGKFPHLTQPNPSYHGLRFTQAAGPAAYLTAIRTLLLRDTGATLAPLHAFLFLQGLESLSLRVERHVENALKIADYLSRHPQVERVHHPALPGSPDHGLYRRYFPRGGVSIFPFEIRGGVEQAHAFIDHLELFSLLASVADVKSLVIHPATTTHAQLSPDELLDQRIRPNTIRLSIGTEHIDDLLADLDQAFRAVESV